MTEPDRFHPTSFTTITVEIDEAAKVAVVTLDRPEAYNAFSPTMQEELKSCLLYTSPSPRDRQKSRMPSSA